MYKASTVLTKADMELFKYGPGSPMNKNTEASRKAKQRGSFWQKESSGQKDIYQEKALCLFWNTSEEIEVFWQYWKTHWEDFGEFWQDWNTWQVIEDFWQDLQEYSKAQVR